MNNNLEQQQHLLQLKRFLNRVSDISFSYNDIKQRIYRENIPTQVQLELLQSLKNEAVQIIQEVKQ
jgi:hypothetical protein